MSAYVSLNLLSELGRKIRCEAVPSILSVFSNEFNNDHNFIRGLLPAGWQETFRSAASRH